MTSVQIYFWVCYSAPLSLSPEPHCLDHIRQCPLTVSFSCNIVLAVLSHVPFSLACMLPSALALCRSSFSFVSGISHDIQFISFCHSFFSFTRSVFCVLFRNTFSTPHSKRFSSLLFSECLHGFIFCCPGCIVTVPPEPTLCRGSVSADRRHNRIQENTA